MVPGFYSLHPPISFYLGSPFPSRFSWSVAVLRQVPSLMASTLRGLYYRSGNISDFANRESLGEKSLKKIRQLQPFKHLARDQETENTRRIVSLEFQISIDFSAIELVKSKAFDLTQVPGPTHCDCRNLHRKRQ